MYHTEICENMSEAQKKVATHLDSLHMPWEADRNICIPHGEEEYYYCVMDFHLCDLGIYVALLSGSEAGKAKMSGIYKTNTHYILQVDTDRPDWQDVLANEIANNISRLELWIARMEKKAWLGE